MPDLIDAYRARHDGSTPAGEHWQEHVNALPPEEFVAAYDAAHREKYGIPAAGIPVADPEATPSPSPVKNLPMAQLDTTVGAFKGMVDYAGAAGEGMLNAGWEIGRTATQIADFLTTGAADGENGNPYRQAIRDAFGGAIVTDPGPMPELMPGKDLSQNLVHGIAQFAAPFAGVHKMFEGYQLMSTAQDASKVAKIAAWSAKAGLEAVPVNIAAFDSAQNNLVDVAKQFGFESELTNYLASQPEDGDAEAKLMNRVRAAITAIPVDLAVPGAASAVKWAAVKAYMTGARGIRALHNANWAQVEKQAWTDLGDAGGQGGTMHDVGGATAAAGKQAAAVAKIVAARIGRLTVAAKQRMAKTGELPNQAELIDGLIAQGVDPASVRQGVDQALSDMHAPDEHTLSVDKREGGRSTRKGTPISKDVQDSVHAQAENARAAANAHANLRETMGRYPSKDGWVEIVPHNVEIDPKTGDIQKVEWAAKDASKGKYTFHLDKEGKPLKGDAKAKAITKLADKMVAEVRDVEQRAAAGDRSAQVIQRQRHWYTEMRTRLREEFGGAGQLFAELLGATSANTAVPQNWDNAIRVLRGFTRGNYDAQLAKMDQWVSEGKSLNDFPVEDKIRNDAGTLFGMNSGAAMQALLDFWKAVQPGQAPKTRNFAGNLIGTSDAATIDVWAARALQRLSGGLRLPALFEAKIPGNWNAGATATTGAYGFGEQVFAEAASKVGMDPHELQAFMWFAEKERWAKEHWTNMAGEGGSFEQMSNASGATRYTAGVSVQQAERPTDATVAAAQGQITRSLVNDPAVVAHRALPTTGMYANSTERAFDMELTALPEWKPHAWVSDLARTAQEHNQYDVLVSKALKGAGDSQNARPGVEVYFRDQKSLEAMQPVLDSITAKGHDGFTFVVDPRMRMQGAPGGEAGRYVGVRLQYVPEIAMRWDDAFREQMAKATPDELQGIMVDKAGELLDIARELHQAEGVLSAHAFWYDSFVMGKENYGDYIERAAEAASGASEGPAWFGRSLRENIGKAARRLGSVPVDGSP